ncbi:MAG: hypothetical protein AB8I08_02065 [Sandaracinaceae bacterium]
MLRATKEAEPHAGQLWLASLWSVLVVAVLPEGIWPLLLSPVLLGLAVLSGRAWMAQRRPQTEADDGTVMRPREALLFGALSGSLIGGLWLGGRDLLFLLPILAGLLFVAGRLLPGTWNELCGSRLRPVRQDVLEDEAPRTLHGLGAEARSALVTSLCRESVRFTLGEASRNLRLALSGRPRREAELRAELSARYGEGVTRVVLETALENKAVRQHGEHLALAMDGAYRAA